VPANFVSRDELRGTLADRSAEVPVTLVCAPAGYGKTLLLADWVEKTGAADKAWVSLDAGDDDAGRFWTAVLNAACACAVVPLTSRLHQLSPPDTPDAPGFVAEAIDAFAALPAPLYLVLDDLHEIIGEQMWHGVATLIRHQPKTTRLVLSTRADPPLPLARLRVQGRLAELRTNELRFSHDDAAELMRRADVGLDKDQVRRLVSQTAGWPAGLRLAARSLRDMSDHDAFLAEFAGNDRAIADFLISEVLARLPSETTDVLQLVSVCDEVTPALAAALAGRDDAGTILAALERDSSLVLGVGTDRQWFRTHPLLRSYLQADLTRQRPDMVTELHETAAAWFAAQEQPDKAFDHVTLTDENRTMGELLRRHAATVLLTGDDHHGVRRALTKVGTEAVARDPWLSLISALARLAAGECASAEAELANVSWPADPDEDLVALRLLVTTTHALACGRRPDAVPADWPGIIAAQEGADLEAWARLGLGWTCLCAGRRTEARRELQAAARLARDHGFDYVAMHSLSALGMLSCSDGAFTAMEAACAGAVAIADAHGWQKSPWMATNHVMIGLARLMSLDPAGTLDQTRYAAAALTEHAEPRLKYVIDLLIGAASVDTGHRQEGLWLMRGARRDLGDVRLPPPVLVAGALLEHRCALELGQDTRAILSWTRANAGEIAEVHLMQAWTSFAHGDLDTTETALREVLTGSQPTLCPTTPLEARLLETALEIRHDRRTKARSTLNTALLLAEPAALVRPFHQADVAVRQLLLEQVGGFGRSNSFAARVSHAVSAMDGQPDGGLTHREHTVLVLLSSPQSLDELASDLSVSVNTVKTHVRAIYTKLGVNTRRAAVFAARQLGID
jgi:LuxR family transcriptional regulator, maltose regulon positive regulatory protein